MKKHMQAKIEFGGLTIPADKLVEIVQDSNEKGIRNLKIGVHDLRVDLVPRSRPFEWLSNRPDGMVMDMELDYMTERYNHVNKVTSELALAFNSKNKKDAVVLINVETVVSGTVPVTMENPNEVLGNYGLQYIGTILRRLDLGRTFGITTVINLPESIGEFQKEETVLYDGKRVKYTYFPERGKVKDVV